MKLKSFAAQGSMYVAGSIIFAASVNIFTAPSGIAPGGMTGIATMVNYLTGLPIGSVILVLNIPLFIWGLRQRGMRAMYKTLAGIILSSAAIDIGAAFMPVYSGDMFLATLYGGALSGLGLSLIFINGGTTGGTDLAASLIMKKFPQFSMGRIIFYIDLVIVALSAAVYRNFESPLYAAVVIFITGRVVDSVLYGAGGAAGKMLLVISDKNEEIAAEIMSRLKRGVTKLNSQGAFTGKKGTVLMCALRRQEIYKARRIISDIDRSAFTVLADTDEITGSGFGEKQ